MSKEWDTAVTVGALALGAGSIAAHHVGASIGAGDVEQAVVKVFYSDLARGVAFGAGGGAAVAIVTRATVMEMMGRTFVGGLMAAVASPWIAEAVLHIPTSSTSYPVLCTSIGVLGYQMVARLIKDPGAIPVIGPILAKLIAPAEAPNSPVQSREQSKITDIAIEPEQRSVAPVRPVVPPSSRIRAPSF
jgi:hypothetical protein